MVTNAKRGSESIIFGNDSVVVQKFISGIPGGRTLFMTGFLLPNVPAGHVIIQYDADGCYGPMPVKANGTDTDGNTIYEYDTLPAGSKYVGINYRTISASNPQSSIMYDGVVNPKCMEIDITPIKTAFAAACPHIIFQEDEDAGNTFNA